MKTRGKEKNADLIIGMALKCLRKKQKLSRNALAPLVGVTGQQIAKYETGGNRVAVSTLFQLLRALDASMPQFMMQFDRISMSLTEEEFKPFVVFNNTLKEYKGLSEGVSNFTAEERKRILQIGKEGFDEKI